MACAPSQSIAVAESIHRQLPRRIHSGAGAYGSLSTQEDARGLPPGETRPRAFCACGRSRSAAVPALPLGPYASRTRPKRRQAAAGAASRDTEVYCSHSGARTDGQRDEGSLMKPTGVDTETDTVTTRSERAEQVEQQ